MSAARNEHALEQIAAKLSGAQKLYLLHDARTIGNPPVWILYGAQSLLSRKTIPTRDVLKRKGLLEDGRFGPTMLTPLGLAVRKFIQDRQA